VLLTRGGDGLRSTDPRPPPPPSPPPPPPSPPPSSPPVIAAGDSLDLVAEVVFSALDIQQVGRSGAIEAHCCPGTSRRTQVNIGY
jgi:hypothetical protein